MKNKKGFVFVETVVVCAILSVSLVTIYAAFAVLLQKQKVRNHYDQAIYNYRLYSIAKEQNNTLPKCDNYNTTINTNLWPDVKIYYVNKNNLQNFNDTVSIEMQDYVKTIEPEDSKCYLIGEFSNETESAKPYFSRVVMEDK